MDHELGIVFINFWANIWELKDIFDQNQGEPVANYQNINLTNINASTLLNDTSDEETIFDLLEPVANFQNISLTNIDASTLLNDTSDQTTIFDLMEPDEIQNITTSNNESSMNTLSGK